MSAGKIMHEGKNIEIEYKFLVDKEKINKIITVYSPYRDIVQGYLSFDPVVRIRCSRWVWFDGVEKKFHNEKPVFTVKTSETFKRNEWNFSGDFSGADDLLALCKGKLIKKHRYTLEDYNHDGCFWEIDFFEGEDFVLAELEVPSEDYKFEKPDWIIKDVSHDPRYYNENMAKAGFNK